MASTTAFTGNVPQNYETYLGPLFFEPYAVDLANRLGDGNYQNILELACGTGRVTKHLLPKLARDGRLAATDLNEAMLVIGKEKVPDDRIQWQAVDAHSLPFDHNSFDLIVCQYGVMFFADKPTALREAFRVLKSGGLFLFNTWDKLEYNVLSQMAKDAMDDLFPGNAPPFLEKGPYSMTDANATRALLQTAGFVNIDIQTVPLTGVAASPDDAASGIVDGTPIAAALAERNTPANAVKQPLKKALEERFGKTDLQLPMQAFVCSASKAE